MLSGITAKAMTWGFILILALIFFWSSGVQGFRV